MRDAPHLEVNVALQHRGSNMKDELSHSSVLVKGEVSEAENHTHHEFFIFYNEIWEDHLQSLLFLGRKEATF